MSFPSWGHTGLYSQWRLFLLPVSPMTYFNRKEVLTRQRPSLQELGIKGKLSYFFSSSQHVTRSHQRMVAGGGGDRWTLYFPNCQMIRNQPKPQKIQTSKTNGGSFLGCSCDHHLQAYFPSSGTTQRSNESPAPRDRPTEKNRATSTRLSTSLVCLQHNSSPSSSHLL